MQSPMLCTKVHIVKAMVFPVVIYGCEGWTIRKAECQRIDASELWCWRRPLRVPRTARRSNQSILKEINPEYSLEGLMLKLKLQCFGHLMQRADSLEKTLLLGKTEGRRRGQERTRWLDGIANSMDMSLRKLQGMVKKPGLLQSMGSQRVRHNRTTEQQSCYALEETDFIVQNTTKRLLKVRHQQEQKCLMNHFAIQQKLTQHCKASIHQ